MKVKWMLLGLLLCALALSGCTWLPGGVQGSGTVLTESRSVEAFDAINYATIGTLHITMGETASLRIEAEDNLLPYFTVEVVNHTLSLKSQSGVQLLPTRPINFYLTITNLEALTLNGSGNAILPDLDGDMLVLTLNGSGNLEAGHLTVTTLETHIKGSGNITIAGADAMDQHRIIITGSGTLSMGDVATESVIAQLSGSGDVSIAGGGVQLQQISLSGSGDYRATRLQSAQAQAEVRGSGAVHITVTKHLSVNLTGSGNVHCTGHPTVEQAIRGSGQLITTEN